MTTPPMLAFAGQQAQAARDVNTASLCRISQETVQDIVLRTMEIFQLLRNMQLPNGVTYHPSTHQDRLGKLQEHLRMLSVLFRKLRLVYDKCNENCTGLDPVTPEVSDHCPRTTLSITIRVSLTSLNWTSFTWCLSHSVPVYLGTPYSLYSALLLTRLWSKVVRCTRNLYPFGTQTLGSAPHSIKLLSVFVPRASLVAVMDTHPPLYFTELLGRLLFQTSCWAIPLFLFVVLLLQSFLLLVWSQLVLNQCFRTDCMHTFN
uniref:Mediator of RNA polymerase II transcription subunit 30 n=1 Tax=Oncorhynchus mykiss TaxID=8022 RepID=A0A8K9V3K0_ONCMY